MPTMNRTTSVELPPTSWSLLGVVVNQGHNAKAARDVFVERYYEPVAAYMAALAGSRDRAEDLTQSFFASRILEGPLLSRADRSLGSFRCYLKRAARNFFLDARRRESRLKRGGEVAAVSIEHAAGLAEASETSEPERAFHSAWIRALLRAALSSVRDECEERRQLSHFDIFVRRFLSEEDPVASWAAIGEAHGLDEKAARGRAETVARHLRRVLRGMLRVELGSAQTVDEELTILQMLLSRGGR